MEILDEQERSKNFNTAFDHCTEDTFWQMSGNGCGQTEELRNALLPLAQKGIGREVGKEKVTR